MSENSKFKFIDLFAGIGGFRTAFERSGAECVFSSDYNKYSQITYKANYNSEISGDITQVKSEEIPDFDILCGGFPCQPFSIAGVSKKNALGLKHGFDDEKQGNLFFELERIIRDKRPKAFFLENVKNLKSHDSGKTWFVIESTLKNLGYNIFSKIVNGKYYVPQHRERIFIVGFSKEFSSSINFAFPEYPTQRLYELKDIIEKEVDAKYTLSDHLWNYLQDRKEKQKEKGNGFGFGLVDLEKDRHTRTLSARYYKDGSEILIKQNNKNPRRLTPRECAKLMGFDDSFKIVVSDTQAYRQFGNSVIVPAIQATANQIVQILQNPQLSDENYWQNYSNQINIKNQESKQNNLFSLIA